MAFALSNRGVIKKDWVFGVFSASTDENARLVERGVSLDTDLPILREEQSSTSPGPCSQNWGTCLACRFSPGLYPLLRGPMGEQIYTEQY